MTGPSNLIFNWGDSHLSTPMLGCIFAVAQLYNHSLAGAIAQNWVTKLAPAMPQITITELKRLIAILILSSIGGLPSTTWLSVAKAI